MQEFKVVHLIITREPGQYHSAIDGRTGVVVIVEVMRLMNERCKGRVHLATYRHLY